MSEVKATPIARRCNNNACTNTVDGGEFQLVTVKYWDENIGDGTGQLVFQLCSPCAAALADTVKDANRPPAPAAEAKCTLSPEIMYGWQMNPKVLRKLYPEGLV